MCCQKYLLLNFFFIKVWLFNAIISSCQAQFIAQSDCISIKSSRK